MRAPNSRVRELLNVASSVLVSGAALVMVGFYFYDRANPPSAEPKYIEEWEEWRDIGIRIGSEDASMVIAGFMDFTCPYCRRLVPVLDSVLAMFPEEVAFEFHYFPLAGHEFGMPSAVAAECAAQQDRFLEMYRILYYETDTLGVVPWRRLGERAGVANLEVYEECLELPPETFKRIMAGRMLGEEIGVFGTPTVWVNGEHFLGRTVSAFTEKAWHENPDSRDRCPASSVPRLSTQPSVVANAACGPNSGSAPAGVTGDSERLVVPAGC